MSFWLQVGIAFYTFFGFISFYVVYLYLGCTLDGETEFSIYTWKGVFNLTFAHEVAVYPLIKDYLNKIGIVIVMFLWTAICLPINIVAFAFILLGEIIRGIVIVFIKLFGERS